MSDGGKGSKSRPYSVTQDEFAENWDRIFGDKNEKDIKIKTGKPNQSSEPGDMVMSGLQQDSSS